MDEIEPTPPLSPAPTPTRRPHRPRVNAKERKEARIQAKVRRVRLDQFDPLREAIKDNMRVATPAFRVQNWIKIAEFFWPKPTKADNKHPSADKSKKQAEVAFKLLKQMESDARGLKPNEQEEGPAK